MNTPLFTITCGELNLAEMFADPGKSDNTECGLADEKNICNWNMYLLILAMLKHKNLITINTFASRRNEERQQQFHWNTHFKFKHSFI